MIDKFKMKKIFLHKKLASKCRTSLVIFQRENQRLILHLELYYLSL